MNIILDAVNCLRCVSYTQCFCSLLHSHLEVTGSCYTDTFINVVMWRSAAFCVTYTVLFPLVCPGKCFASELNVSVSRQRPARS